MSIVMGLVFVILVLAGVPVVVCLLFSSIFTIIIAGQIPLQFIPTLMFGSVDSFILVVIPLFMLSAKIMSEGNIVHEIFNFADSLVGWMRGGLGAVNVVASMIFGGMSGSSVADAAGLGPIEIKAMTEFGYPIYYSTAITLASSTLAVVIPPSILTIIYAIVAEVSVGKMLIAGLLPGIVIAVILIITNYFFAVKYKFGFHHAFSVKRVVKSGRKSFFALLTPIILLGGLLSGVFTATEAAGITALYALVISTFVYKRLTFKELISVFLNTAKDSSIALIVISSASLFSFVLIIDKLPSRVGEWISVASSQPWVILILVSILLIIVGMFMSIVLALIVLTPILLPVVMSIGVDPIHFGIIIVTALAMGLITPPVGSCLYVICGVTKLPIENVSRRLLPFYFVLYIALLIIIFVPQITLFLPNFIWGA